MLKKLFIITFLLLLLNACNQIEEDLITGEVIEINPEEELIEADIVEETEKYNDKMVRVEKMEGDIITLKPDAYDPDGDIIIYTFTKPFNEQGIWQTNEGDAGDYVITVTASDGVLSTSEDLLIVVSPVNKAPVIECNKELSFKETDLVKIDCNIIDPEEDELTIKYSGWMNSTEYQTSYNDAGEYEVLITASDNERTSSKTLNIIVKNLNRVPEVSDIETIEVEETEKVVVKVDASDSDKDSLTYKYSDPLNKNGVWQTKLGDAGTYTTKVIVSDGTGSVKKEFEIVVLLKNTAPSLDFIEPITVDEGEIITLPINTYDREGDELTVDISGWFETETYTTTYEDAGNYTLTINVSDGKLTRSQTIEIIVNDVNRAPVFIMPG
ncbi:hypothetical protein CMO90_02520 [Candidatus Woesearchaeota archaeon]|jgi:hypothetical protein|nr:hypothetical protein [Candidatus Woesearchaeota archaeon]